MGCGAVKCYFKNEAYKGCALLGFYPAAHLDIDGRCRFYTESEPDEEKKNQIKKEMEDEIN